MLEVKNLNVHYGVIHALKDVCYGSKGRRDCQFDRRKRCRKNDSFTQYQRTFEENKWGYYVSWTFFE